MEKADIVRAWKNEHFHAKLSAQQRGEMFDDPSGEIELDDESLTFAGATETGEDSFALTGEKCQMLTPHIDTGALCASEQLVSLYLCPPKP